MQVRQCKLWLLFVLAVEKLGTYLIKCEHKVTARVLLKKGSVLLFLSVTVVLSGDKRSSYSPKHAVSRKWITVSCTVAGTAAVFVKAPVSHHAPVAVGSPDARFADAVSIGGITERAICQVEGHGAHGVTVTCWKGEKKRNSFRNVEGFDVM